MKEKTYMTENGVLFTVEATSKTQEKVKNQIITGEYKLDLKKSKEVKK